MLVGSQSVSQYDNNCLTSAFYHNRTELFISAFQAADNGEINTLLISNVDNQYQHNIAFYYYIVHYKLQHYMN